MEHDFGPLKGKREAGALVEHEELSTVLKGVSEPCRVLSQVEWTIPQLRGFVCGIDSCLVVLLAILLANPAVNLFFCFFFMETAH